MPEYIEREALFKRLKEETHDYDAVGKYKEGIIKGLNIAKSIVNDKARTPTADVVEVKHGEWIYSPETINSKSGYICSVCRDPMWHSPDVPQAFRYCPNCGAKMDGDE